MKRYIQLYESWSRPDEITLISRFGKIVLTIRHGKIESILNTTSIDFPFVVGHPVQLPFIKSWATRAGFKLKDAATPDKKLFGIKTRDIPMGHELRSIYPNRFRD
jgi:hypothetical protein